MGFKAYEFWYHDMERDGRGSWIKKENAKDLDMIYQLNQEVGGKNVKILYDLFHVQIMNGNIIATVEEYVDLIGHIHISGVPGQHEPVNGELNLPLILKKLADLGYKGYFGLEYYPLKEVIPSLEETVEYLADVASF